MKILYAIQGTGNGHLSRARDIIPILQKKGAVDILVSGIQVDVELPYDVKYRYRGMSFIFGKKGGVDIWQTLKKTNLPQLIREIKGFPVDQYDIVLNDFEPVSAWAAKLKKKKIVGISHQAAVLAKNAPKPKFFDLVGWLALKYYAPAPYKYGFHFRRYDDYVYPPVIRQQIRDLKPEKKGHYTVYLPAYDDDTLINALSNFGSVTWEVFSKHNKEPKTVKNVFIQPINNDAYIESLRSCTGVLCGAGFEGPAEALFLNKKVLAIPMKTQYEQHCNAAGLKDIGVPIVYGLTKKYYPIIKHWIENEDRITVDYPNITEEIIDTVFHDYFKSANP